MHRMLTMLTDSLVIRRTCTLPKVNKTFLRNSLPVTSMKPHDEGPHDSDDHKKALPLHDPHDRPLPTRATPNPRSIESRSDQSRESARQDSHKRRHESKEVKAEKHAHSDRRTSKDTPYSNDLSSKTKRSTGEPASSPKRHRHHHSHHSDTSHERKR